MNVKQGTVKLIELTLTEIDIFKGMTVDSVPEVLLQDMKLQDPMKFSSSLLQIKGDSV